MTMFFVLIGMIAFSVLLLVALAKAEKRRKARIKRGAQEFLFGMDKTTKNL